ncbi:CD48 antigen isoform X2 [Mustela nigripes]|uniref:CD48 antigen isoform X2 n=1 Tax=Mustela nigripes TaxID=77151 RepID=UPI00281643DD|nr:CD48 antigen isoform X2 [Mustela nigripes]
MCSQRQKPCLALELLLLFHLVWPTSTQGPSEHRVTAISGTNVCLPISNLPAKYIQLTWFYTTNQKILEWESNQILLFDSEFKGRVSLGQNQNLCIHNVQKNDSSTYILRVLTDSGTEKEWHTRLEVYGLQNSVLDIIVEPNNYSTFYTCQLSNPVSSKNDTVYFTPPCKLGRSSAVAWIMTWLIVMVPVVPGLLWT